MVYPIELTAQGLVEQRKARIAAIMDEPVTIDMIGAPPIDISAEAWDELGRKVDQWAAEVKLRKITAEFK